MTLFDRDRAKEICQPASEIVVPVCAVANCPNSADPRYGFVIGRGVNAVFAPACDGHESYDVDRYQLRDPLPSWPMRKEERERQALDLLPQALAEIDRLRILTRRACYLCGIDGPGSLRYRVEQADAIRAALESK